MSGGLATSEIKSTMTSMVICCRHVSTKTLSNVLLIFFNFNVMVIINLNFYFNLQFPSIVFVVSRLGIYVKIIEYAGHVSNDSNYFFQP